MIGNENNKVVITQHAKERYAERIMGKDSKADVIQYIANNESKIDTDIAKMVNYGEPVYVGKNPSQSTKKQELVNVYRNNCWLVLTTESLTVITLFKVAFGVGEDLDKLYIDRLVEQIKQLEIEQKSIEKENKAVEELTRQEINSIIMEIERYRKAIKMLEETKLAKEALINTSKANLVMTEQKMVDIANKMLGKKYF